LHDGRVASDLPPLLSLPMPLIIDMMPPKYSLPVLETILAETAVRTELIALIDSRKWPLPGCDGEHHLPHLAFYFDQGARMLPPEVLKKTRLVEIQEAANWAKRAQELKTINPDIVVSVRVNLDEGGIDRAVALCGEGVEVIHIVADNNGDEIGAARPRFIKDMIRTMHTTLIQKGARDEVTIIAGGGIALPEHMAKGIICGADVVSVDLPLLIALECHLCGACEEGHVCPAKIKEITMEYGVGRMTNLISAWHNQLIELMGAMGMRDARRLRGDVGRAMFFEQLEEETFGKLFGTRLQA
jgi:hypothetical protein